MQINHKTELKLSQKDMTHVRIVNSGTVIKPRRRFNTAFINVISHKLRYLFKIACDFNFK